MQAEKAPSSANWKSCTYLHLYTYILRVLAAARDKMHESRGESFLSHPNAYILSPSYFLGKICRALIKRSGHGDMPYVWKTTQGNRKRNIGKYVAVDVNSLKKSTEELEMNLKGQCSGGNSRVHLPAPAAVNNRIMQFRIKALHALNHKNLHDILMKIPYNFLQIQEGGTPPLRPGSFIALAHVIISSLLFMAATQNRGPGVTWKDILEVDASAVYDLLQDDDPFRSSRLTIGMKHARWSNIHLLWDSKESFVQSANKVKKAIKSRLKKFGTNAAPLPSSTGFKLDDLQVARDRFTFLYDGETIKEMIQSNNGIFVAINDKLAVQLKVLCLLIYIFELRRQRECTSRIHMNQNSASFHEHLFKMVQKCHTENSYKSVSDFNNTT